MKCKRTNLWLLLIIIIFGKTLYCQDRYYDPYPFDRFQTFYGIEHEDDAFSSMRNPALAGMLQHDGKGAFMISYNDWFIYSPLSIGTLLPVSEDMELGFSFNYIDVPVMYGCLIGYGSQRYYNLSTALVYHHVVDISLGFSAKLYREKFNLTPELSETQDYRDFDAGVLIQLPLMAATNRGTFDLFKREMKIELTPGFQMAWINILDDAYPTVNSFYKASLYDVKMERNIFDMIFSGGNQDGVKFGLMDLVTLYIERIENASIYTIYEFEVNCSQFARDAIALISKKQIKKGVFAKSDILISYGTWDLGSSIRRNNVNVSLKYNF